MLKYEFNKLVGKDVIVLYNFNGEIQEWNMKNFEFDERGKPRHKIIDSLIMNVFIKNVIGVKGGNKERREII